jgi:cephalosporin-C deacetylase-like acetyl esterase
VAGVLTAAAALAQSDDARQRLIRDLNAVGLRQLESRAAAIARIEPGNSADQRQRDVRSKLIRLIGPPPESGKPVEVRDFGAVQGEGFRVEKIAYRSLPGIWVTADVYVPLAGKAPYPAVLLWPGHEQSGKLGQYNWGANLAVNGMIALAVDPLGQGERVQHFDPELGESKVGGSTGEHGHAGYSTLLLGDHVSHYFLADAMRAVDYLSYRKDVDAARIGAFGCSGGGTATAYLTAFDPRIKAAVVACYITSFEALLPTAGPQEAEQTIPHFLEEGLDFADWVELAAPKPYAIVSTEADMFPFAGARQTFEEAKRFWTLYGAGDRIEWITGPGGHGNLGPVSPRILAFLGRWLKDEKTPPQFRQFKPMRREDLLCTPTGQLSTSIGSGTVESYNREQARVVLSASVHRAPQARLIRTTAMMEPEPPAKSVSSVVTRKTETRDGYRLETLEVSGEPTLAGIPDGDARKGAVILLDSAAKEATAARPDFERLVKAGRIVVVLQPRGTPGPNTVVQSGLLGPFNLIALRAMLVGRTLVGMRAEDTLQVVEWLAGRPDIDRASITLYGNGPEGVVALHAAALDKRVTRVVIENTLISYRRAITQSLHRNLPEIALPGVLRAYDLGDLMLAIAPAPVTVLNPVDAVGQPVSEEVFRKELAYIFPGGLVRLASRSPRDPLPID